MHYVDNLVSARFMMGKSASFDPSPTLSHRANAKADRDNVDRLLACRAHRTQPRLPFEALLYDALRLFFISAPF